jgi:hypothetical protein
MASGVRFVYYAERSILAGITAFWRLITLRLGRALSVKQALPEWK